MIVRRSVNVALVHIMIFMIMNMRAVKIRVSQPNCDDDCQTRISSELKDIRKKVSKIQAHQTASSDEEQDF